MDLSVANIKFLQLNLIDLDTINLTQNEIEKNNSHLVFDDLMHYVKSAISLSSIGFFFLKK